MDHGLTEEDVRDAFYEQVATAMLLWGHGLNSVPPLAFIQLGILIIIIEGRDGKGGYVLCSGQTLNDRTCPETYRPLLAAFRKLESDLKPFIHYERKIETIRKLILGLPNNLSVLTIEEQNLIRNICNVSAMMAHQINQRPTFAQRISQVKDFVGVIPVISEPIPRDENIIEEDVRETFRSLQADEAVREISKDPTLKESILSGDPFIFQGFAGLALIRWILDKDPQQDGYNLQHNKVLNSRNCPRVYRQLFNKIQPLERKLRNIHGENLNLIYLWVLNNPQKEELLEQTKRRFSPEILKEISGIVADINSVAIPITQLSTYGRGFQRVLTLISERILI